MAHFADTYRKPRNAPLQATELCQVQLKSLSDAETVFNYGNSKTMKPIVALGPSTCFPFCCFHCCVSVPSGYHLLFQQFNARYTVGVDSRGVPMPYKKEGYDSSFSNFDFIHSNTIPIRRSTVCNILSLLPPLFLSFVLLPCLLPPTISFLPSLFFFLRLICCWPWYKRVSHVVTQKAVRFNAPVSGSRILHS